MKKLASLTLIAAILLTLGATSFVQAFEPKSQTVIIGAKVLPYAVIRFPSGGQQFRFRDLEGKAGVYNVDGILPAVTDIFEGTFRVPTDDDDFRGLQFWLDSNTSVTVDFAFATQDLLGNPWHNQPTLFEVRSSNNEAAYAGANVMLGDRPSSFTRGRGLEQFWIDGAIKIENISDIEPNYYGGSLIVTLSQAQD